VAPTGKSFSPRAATPGQLESWLFYYRQCVQMTVYAVTQPTTPRRMLREFIFACLLVAVALFASHLAAITHAQTIDPNSMEVRVTHYTIEGLTYSEKPTAPGVAACSWEIPLGTVLVFQKDRRVVTCLDRGPGLGNHRWVDVWTKGEHTGYDDYERVLIHKWGDGTVR